MDSIEWNLNIAQELPLKKIAQAHLTLMLVLCKNKETCVL
jgi:hypothetical protein